MTGFPDTLSRTPTLPTTSRVAAWSWSDTGLRFKIDRPAALVLKGPIVVGTDGSADAELALELAFQLARRNSVPLIVVGARGWDGFYGLKLGSTCQALLAHAPGAVMVARANE